eukprot:31499-Pelagococcus_subviridis.AAC.49
MSAPASAMSTIEENSKATTTSEVELPDFRCASRPRAARNTTTFRAINTPLVRLPDVLPPPLLLP